MIRTKKRTTMVVIGALFILAATVPAASAGTDPPPGLPLYIALGDSLAAGEGSSDRATSGYVPLVHDDLQTQLDCVPARSEEAVDGCKHLQLVNLGRSATPTLRGVTTQAVIDEQLPVAVPEITARNGDANPNNDVAVISIDVGGNDAFQPIIDKCLFGFDEECKGTIFGVFATVATNYDTILESLRQAAGPEAQIVVMTYYNPLPFCYLGPVPGANQLGDIVLEGAPGLLAFGLNDIIRGAAAAHGASVAEAFGLLGEGDFVGGTDCLHPSDAGYRELAEAFTRVINQP